MPSPACSMTPPCRGDGTDGPSVIFGGGITSVDDLERLATEFSIEGVIIGRALYDGRIDLRAAQRGLRPADAGSTVSGRRGARRQHEREDDDEGDDDEQPRRHGPVRALRLQSIAVLLREIPVPRCPGPNSSSSSGGSLRDLPVIASAMRYSAPKLAAPNRCPLRAPYAVSCHAAARSLCLDERPAEERERSRPRLARGFRPIARARVVEKRVRGALIDLHLPPCGAPSA